MTARELDIQTCVQRYARLQVRSCLHALDDQKLILTAESHAYRGGLATKDTLGVATEPAFQSQESKPQAEETTSHLNRPVSGPRSPEAQLTYYDGLVARSSGFPTGSSR